MDWFCEGSRSVLAGQRITRSLILISVVDLRSIQHDFTVELVAIVVGGQLLSLTDNVPLF